MPVEVRMIQQAYKFALQPAQAQLPVLAAHCRGSRYAFNWALEQKYTALKAQWAEKEAGGKATTQIPNYFTLTPVWNAFKTSGDACQRCSTVLHPEYSTWNDRDGGILCRDGEHHEHGHGLPWAANNSSGIYLAALRDADMAFTRWFTSLRGDLKGRPAGRPKFKGAGKSRDSFQLMGPGVKVLCTGTSKREDTARARTPGQLAALRQSRGDATHLQLPTIGQIAISEPHKKLTRQLRTAGQQAHDLTSILAGLREKAGLTITETAAALTGLADQRARDKAAASAAEEMRKALAALERATTDETRAKAADRIARASGQQERASQASSNRIERWSERKYGEAERTGQITWDQAADLCTALDADQVTRGQLLPLAQQARIIRATVSRDAAGRWHCVLTCAVPKTIRTGPSARQRAGGTIGVDFGTRHVITPSRGEAVPAPRSLEKAQRKLARLQRKMQRQQGPWDPETKSRRQPSGRWLDTREQVGRLHAQVASAREDALQQATSHLIHSHEVIAVENWDVSQTFGHPHRLSEVDRDAGTATCSACGPDTEIKIQQRLTRKGMKDTVKCAAAVPARLRRDRNRHLADAGIGMGRAMLESKAPWYGAQVQRFGSKTEPSGRRCSRCGGIRFLPVPPHDDWFLCDQVTDDTSPQRWRPGCGNKMLRRLNTARLQERYAKLELEPVT